MQLNGSAIIMIGRRVLLIKRNRDKKTIPNFWSLPGGGIEKSETPEDAAIREVKEETNLDFKIERLYTEVSVSNLHFYIFIGTASGTVKLQTEECDGYGWFTYLETKSLPTTNNIERILDSLFEEYILE